MGFTSGLCNELVSKTQLFPFVSVFRAPTIQFRFPLPAAVQAFKLLPALPPLPRWRSSSGSTPSRCSRSGRDRNAPPSCLHRTSNSPTLHRLQRIRTPQIVTSPGRSSELCYDWAMTRGLESGSPARRPRNAIARIRLSKICKTCVSEDSPLRPT